MTFTAQTGYHRPHPRGLCQDHAYLLAATSFDFDLSDADFVTYFKTRTGIDLRETSYKVSRHRTAEEWQFLVGELITGQDTHSRLMRGKLQDCWELYHKPVAADEPKYQKADCFQNVKRERLLVDEVITATPGYVCPSW